MSNITRAQLKTLRAEMQAALDKAGITDFELEVGGMRFTTTEVTIKVQGKLKGVKAGSDRIFEDQVARLGLNMIGRKGERLVGYKPSRYKYPFSYVTVRGAQYKCSVDQAKTLFGK